MNNISEETTKKKQIVIGLHLLRDYLSHSNKDWASQNEMIELNLQKPFCTYQLSSKFAISLLTSQLCV